MAFSIDQTRDSFACLEADCNGFVMRSLQNFKWTSGIEADLVYNNSSVPIGMPAGMFKGDGSFQVIPSEALGLIRSVGPEYTQVNTNIGATLNQPNGGGIIPVTFAVVRLMKMEWDLGEAGGQKASLVTLNFTMITPPDYAGVTEVIDQGAASLFQFPAFLGL